MKNTFPHKSFWLLCLLSGFGLQACQYPWEPDPPAPENVLLDREFMDYVGLPDNSYWIYRNVSTGELDSSYIGVIDTQMIDWDFGRNKVEYLNEERIGYVQLRGNKYKCNWYTSKGEKGVDQVLTKTNYFKMSSEELGMSKTMSWKYDNALWEHHKDPQNYTLTDFHEHLDLGSTSYQNIVHIETGNDWENKTMINHAYYVKGIGPVYRIFSDSSEWELLRYKLGEYVIPIGN